MPIFTYNDDYIAPSVTQIASGQVRESISDNWKWAYDFGTTTFNMIPSIGASILSNAILPGSGAVVGNTLMGASAIGNAYQEKINAGWDKDQAMAYSTLVGVSEAGLQYVLGGIGKLGGRVSGKSVNAIARGIDSALGRIALTLPGKWASEGIEEGLQEILAPAFENLLLGYAENELSDVEWGQVASSAILGALSAGLFETGSTVRENFGANKDAKRIGADIRSNNKVQEMLETASLTPEQSEAYKLNARYLKRGVDSENVTDLQLGRLYDMVDSGAKQTLSSKGSTLAQRESATETLKRLSEINKERSLSQSTMQSIEESTKAERDYVNEADKLIAAGLETKEGTESYKLAAEMKKVADSGETVDIGDTMKLALEINKTEFAKTADKTMTEENAKLAKAIYDGKTEPEAFVNSFNLVSEYVDKKVDADYILEHKGVLTAGQVEAITKTLTIEKAQARQKAIDTLAEKQGKSMFIQGTVDDSIIDYNSSTKDGSKINWKNLTSRQRDAVNFVKMFSQATGVNVRLIQSKVKNGEHTGKNGSYDPDTNTIELDVFAGRIDVGSVTETIIPTLSHEVTHWMEKKAPELYRALSEKVMTSLSETAGKSRSDLIDERIRKMKKNHPDMEITPEMAVNELVARACEDMLADSKKMRELLEGMSLKERQTFAEKVKTTLKNLMKWVNNLLKQYSSTSEEAKYLRDYKEALEEISKLWDEAFASAVNANQVLQNAGVKETEVTEKEENRNKSKDAEMQFCERENTPNDFNPDGLTLKEQLREAFDTAISKERRYVYIGEFTNAFVNKLKKHIAIKKYPIVMNYRDAYLSMESKENGKYQGDNINYHNLGIDGLEAALKSFDSPEYVLLSKKEGKIELILEGKDYKGRQLFSIVEVNTKAQHRGRFMDAHVVTSVYGNRSLKKRIDIATEEGRVIYNKNEESAQGMPPVQYQRDINANSSSNNSISQTEEKSQEVFSDREYSYDELVAKDDLKGIVIGKNQQVKLTANGSIDAGWIISEVKKKCKELTTSPNTSVYYTEVADIERNVEISNKGIIHSFFKSVGRTKKASQRDLINARVSLEIPNILKNSIEVNRSARDGNIDVPYSHIMMGTVALEDANGNLEYYAVRSVIEERVNQNPILVEAEVLGKLHAVNAKKIGTPNVQVAKNGVALAYDVAYTYNIAQFLEDVKMEFDDTFSEDVYNRLGMARKENEFSKNLQFSDRETETIHDIMGENERVKRENKKLKADFDRLVERLKLERQVTKGDRFDRRRLELVAGHLRKLANSTTANEKLVPMLEETFGYIARMDDPDAYNGVQLRLNEIAEAIMADAKPETVSDAYAKLILRNIRGSRISLSETQIQEAKNRFGDKWRNSFLGKVIIAKDGISLDSWWQEQASQYPAYFDKNVSEADQVEALFNLYNDLKDIAEITMEYDIAEQTRWLVSEILNQFWNTKPIETISDKYEKRIKELNFEHRKMMKELQNDYKDRMEKQKLELRWNTAKMLHDLRTKKDSEIAEAKRLGRERLAKYRENAARKTEIQKITNDALTMNKWLTKNSKDAHINEFMKGIVAKYIQAIDFSSKQLLGMEGTVKDNRGTPTQNDVSLSKALREVQNMMSSETINREGLYDLYGHDLGENIESLVNRVDDVMHEVGDNAFVLNQMSLEELKSLQKIGSTIKHAVSKMNDFHAVHHAKGIANLSQESMVYLNSLGEAKVYDDIRGTVSSVVKWDNILPYYAFKRYGAGGEKIFEAFQDGQDKLAFNVRDVIAFTEATYTDEDVKKWSEEIKTFKVPVPATEIEMSREGYEPKYRNVQMTVAQVMSLYCLQKRQQAKGHMLGGGLRIANIKIDGKKDIVQTKGITLTEKGLSDIVGSLTDKQRTVADKLQEFMNTVCADWGNEISMKRFGYKAFTEENYFPIQSDANVLQGDVTENKGSDLFRLLNMSFTKSTVIGANNRIVVGNIFDVFAQHSSDMAEYNALALPVLDANKWFNYKEDAPEGEKSFETSSVKEAIEGAFGIDGQSYFTTFLKDINGAKADESKAAKIAGSFFKNAKVAAVGANLRVVLLQPTSYLRASAIIDGQYLTRALAHKPKISMAKQHCGMALWKSLGYYDTNIQRGVEEQIKHDKKFKDKLTDASLWGAGKADELTWGYLWNACELEIRDTRKDLKVGSEEFYQTIGKRLREIIYATQVVDSTMTRSQTMRRRGMYDKMITAFGSEPTLAYNMVMDAYMSYSLDKKSMGKEAAKKKHLGRIGKVMWAYTVTNAMAALVEFAFDALRDDDDEKESKDFLLMYLKNFGMDMELTSKIPYIKELWSLAQGFDSTRTDTQGISYLVKACRNIMLSKGKPATTLKYATQGLSYLSGLPFYNAFRDILATMHKFDLLTAENFNEMFDLEEDD